MSLLNKIFGAKSARPAAAAPKNKLAELEKNKIPEAKQRLLKGGGGGVITEIIIVQKP